MKIQRSEYLKWLQRWRGQQIIKVVSGVRRCGKSTLFDIYKDWLCSTGVSKDQIISLNFEDIEFEALCDYHALYRYISERLDPKKMNYVFLDEIQHVPQYEKVVDSLFLKANCDVYITGSNAYFMSGELATNLSGRYVELKMLPLSFAEFSSVLARKENASHAQIFNRYLELGAFPYILRYGKNRKEAHDYLQDIYNSVLLKDIVARLKVSDVTTLENLTKFLFHNIGSFVSPLKIANTFKSQGKGVDQKTIDKYLHGLTDSLIIYEARRYNLKGKMLLKTNSKYYAVDIGLRNMLVKTREDDLGHILENLVFLELERRGYQVFVGQMEGGTEVDFVAINGDKIAYYQVSASTLNETTLARELAPLRQIKDNYPKYLLTLDEIVPSANYDGIQKVNALDWFCSK